MIVKVKTKDGWQMFSGLDSVRWDEYEESEFTCEPCFSGMEIFDFLPEHNKENPITGPAYIIYGYRANMNARTLRILVQDAFVLNDEGKTIERI